MHGYAPEAARPSEWWITTRLRDRPGIKLFWGLVIIGVGSAALFAVLSVVPYGLPLSAWGLLIFMVFVPITCVGTALAGYAASWALRGVRRTPIREHSAGIVLAVLVGTIPGAAVIVSGWFLVFNPTAWGWWELINQVGSPLLGAAYTLKSTAAPVLKRSAV